MNKVDIGGVEAQVISSTATEINVFVPSVLAAGNYEVKLSTIQWNRTAVERIP